MTAIRDTPPGFSFNFPICFFTGTSTSETSPAGKAEESADAGYVNQPRVLNTSDREGQVILLPQTGPAPRLTLSCPLISGNYEVSVLVSPLEPGFILDKKTFQARAAGLAGFRPPRDVIILTGEVRKAWAYSLAYGPMRVTGGHFALELDFKPGPKHRLMVHHIKFSPPLAEEIKLPERGELSERMNKLRSLGYAQKIR